MPSVNVEQFRTALQYYNGNVSRAVKAIGVSRAAVYARPNTNAIIQAFAALRPTPNVVRPRQVTVPLVDGVDDCLAVHGNMRGSTRAAFARQWLASIDPSTLTLPVACERVRVTLDLGSAFDKFEERVKAFDPSASPIAYATAAFERILQCPP